MTAPIVTHNLSKRFGGVMALDGMDLSVPEGSIYALVGPNGAGKTTTIKILMNIFSPGGGDAELLGVNSRRLSPRELTLIGYVSENQEMPEWMTVENMLAYLEPFYPTWDSVLAAELMRQLDLPPRRRLRHLSRGMRMKAALAAALSFHPRLIILDEPFSGLDSLVRDELIQTLLGAAAAATTFISSHDLAEIESFASHVGFLDRGRLQFSEEMSALAERFREVEITLGSAAGLPAAWPCEWLRPESSAAVVRFVDSRFDRERTSAEIRSLFPDARDVSFQPMTLRAIFVVLAKTARKAA